MCDVQVTPTRPSGIRRNPRTWNGSVRRYPPQASLVILPPLAIAEFVESGSVQSTPKTNRGIAALLSQVKRVVKDNSRNWQLSAHSRGLT